MSERRDEVLYVRTTKELKDGLKALGERWAAQDGREWPLAAVARVLLVRGLQREAVSE